MNIAIRIGLVLFALKLTAFQEEKKPQDAAGAKKAEELIEKIADRCAAAKSMLVEFKIESAAMLVPAQGYLKMKGNGAFIYRVEFVDCGQKKEFSIKSDGRKVVATGMGRSGRIDVKPEEIAPFIRRCVSHSLMALLMTARGPEGKAPEPMTDEFAWEGREKVGGVDAAVVSSRFGAGPRQSIRVKAWVNEEKLVILKREFSDGGAVVTEAISKLQYDVEMPDEDFRSNDRDNNGMNDFWVKDVAGMFGLEPGTGKEDARPAKDPVNAIKLIESSTAKADATAGRRAYPIVGDLKEPEPRSGYLFAALKSYVDATGAVRPYDTGAGRNNDRFGFVAYPLEYGVTGVITLIINEDNTLWAKDLQGEMIEAFPRDPAKEGWTNEYR
ncbi:MAG: DUF2950 family protein [Planctomycetes bacterium]|nr:DUF2950 family protein [Planctomycetota bacterium]